MKKKYNWAILPFGLTFWTHSFTPFFFAGGLLLYAFYRKEEKKDILKIIIFGLLLGVPWLYRFLIYHDWVHPNTAMPEHLLSWKFFYQRFFVEGWSFAVILFMSFLGVILNSSIIKKIKENRLLTILVFFSLATLPTYFYPERGITYTVPFLMPIAGFILLNLSLSQLKKSSLVILPLLLSIVFYSLSPAEWLQGYQFSFRLVIFILMLVFVWAYLKAGKKIIFYLILLLIFYFLPERNVIMLPFLSWWKGGIASKHVPVEIYDACLWLKQYDPNAVFATDSTQLIGACQYLGLKSSEAPVMEFTKDGGVWHHLGANYFISVYGNDNNDADKDFKFLWKKGQVNISRFVSKDSLQLKFSVKNPTDFSRVSFGFADNVFTTGSKGLASSGDWSIENECYFFIDNDSYKNKIYSLSFSMDQESLILTDGEKGKYGCQLNFDNKSSSLFSRGNKAIKFQISFQDKNNFLREDKYVYQFNLFLTDNKKFNFTDTPTSYSVLWADRKGVEKKIAPIFKMEGENFDRQNP